MKIGQNGEEHQGGYSTHIRAQEKFVFHIPEQLKSQDAASMYVLIILEMRMSVETDIRLCGGLTVYAPMIRNGAGPGKKIGVVGLGGL
jgi:alcohol dehydrogenase (NADP+)